MLYLTFALYWNRPGPHSAVILYEVEINNTPAVANVCLTRVDSFLLKQKLSQQRFLFCAATFLNDQTLYNTLKVMLCDAASLRFKASGDPSQSNLTQRNKHKCGQRKGDLHSNCKCIIIQVQEAYFGVNSLCTTPFSYSTVLLKWTLTRP